MTNKKVADVGKKDTSQKKEQGDDFFERLQAIYPTMTLDEIGDLLFNKYLYRRKFKMPNQ